MTIDYPANGYQWQIWPWQPSVQPFQYTYTYSDPRIDALEERVGRLERDNARLRRQVRALRSKRP